MKKFLLSIVFVLSMLSVFSVSVCAENIDDSYSTLSSGNLTYSYFETPLYSDVKTHLWFFYEVQSLGHRGIMEGYPDGTFGPEGNLTRAEATAILYRAYAGELGSVQNSPFSDIDSHWARNYIIWAYKNNIVSGAGDGKFYPNTYITRQDFATMIVRYCNYAESATLPVRCAKKVFADDSSIASYAKASVYMLQQAQIIQGDDTGKFWPTRRITRAETARMIDRNNGSLIDSGVFAVDEQKGFVIGSTGVPTGFICNSTFFQKYRVTSNKITFYETGSDIYMNDIVTQIHWVRMYAGGLLRDTLIKRGDDVISSRKFNVKQSGYQSDTTITDTIMYFRPQKFAAKGIYTVTGNAMMEMSMPEGGSGGRNFDHEISVVFR